MAVITNLEACFNYHSEYNTVSNMIQDIIDRLRNEAKELEKNDIYYGTKTFSCDGYIPIKSKMDEVNRAISVLDTELIEAKKSLKKAFYTKAKQDLTDYITYLNEKFLNPNEQGYNYYKNAGGDNASQIAKKDLELYHTRYLTYKEYLPYRNQAEQKLHELERIYNSTVEV